MTNRLPIPRIERRSRASLLWDAADGGYPRVVDSAHQLTAEECRVYCAPCGAWEACGRYYQSREAAESAMCAARWFGRIVSVIDRRKR